MMKKIMKTVLAVALVSGIFAGYGSHREISAADLEFQKEFNETIEPILKVCEGFDLDFYNFNLSEHGLDGGYAHLIQTALDYVPYEFSEDYTSIIMDATQLQIFMNEAFGCELPLEDIGMYTYDAKTDSFSWPASDGPIGINVFVINNLTENGDGSLTAETDLYFADMFNYDYDVLESCYSLPVSEWDPQIFTGKIASPAITFMRNREYDYFPIRLIGVSSEVYDWEEAQGTYLSEDGKFGIALGVDERYSLRHLYAVATKISTGENYEMDGYTTANLAVLISPENYEYTALVALEDGRLTVTDLDDIIVEDDISGVYVKESDDIPPKPFFFVSDTYSIEGAEIVEGEPNYIGNYSIPIIEGLGDEDFEAYLNQYIADLATNDVEDYLWEYNEFGKDVEKEEDEALKAELKLKLESFWYSSKFYALSASDNYYALANKTVKYTGGGHIGSFVQVFNIDASNKKLLTISDLFKADVNWYEEIDKILAEMSLSDEYIDLLYSESEPASLSSDAYFYLENGNLVIFYNPYEIGPYAAGYIVFEIPVEDISHLLKDEYLNARYKNETDKDVIFFQ